MVVCESGFMASTLASIMMNGVCCLWQMEEENERQLKQREAIRRDIRVEYERQRQIEQELWLQRQQCQSENWYSDAPSVNTDYRRRKLLAEKNRVASLTLGQQQQQQQEEHVKDASANSSRDNCRDEQLRDPVPVLVQQLSSPLSRQPLKKRRVRIASPNNAAEFPIVSYHAPKSPQDMSSLLDSAFDDDEEEEGNCVPDDDLTAFMMEEETTSLVDVPLH